MDVYGSGSIMTVCLMCMDVHDCVSPVYGCVWLCVHVYVCLGV